MSDQTLDTIGKILDSGKQRDAVHFAVASITAAMRLNPGQHVGLDGTDAAPIGVVDPFLKSPVEAGECCWMILYPNTITGLRHEWTHPAFEGGARAESETYLRAFADRLFSYYGKYEGEGSRFDLLISQAESGGFGTDIEYANDCQPTKEFWDHFERYTGRKVVHRPAHFRCAC
jgi:hypothetical protein